MAIARDMSGLHTLPIDDDKCFYFCTLFAKKEGESMKKEYVGGGTVYGLGFLGALLYYIQHSATFWIGILGFLKALVWPAFLIFKVFEFLKM